MSYPHQPSPSPYVGGHGPSYAPPPPRKNRTGQVVAIVALGVVALLGFATAAVLFVTGGDESTATEEPTAGGSEAPQEPAAPTGTTDPGEAGLVALGEAYADAINRADAEAATALTCDRADAGHLYTLVVGDSTEFTAENPHVKPDIGSGSMDITYPESAGPYAFSGYYQNGSWCTDPY